MSSETMAHWGQEPQHAGLSYAVLGLLFPRCLWDYAAICSSERIQVRCLRDCKLQDERSGLSLFVECVGFICI